MKKSGAISFNADPCIYRIGHGDNTILIAVYVDDIILVSRNLNKIEELKKNLVQEFDVRDLGEINYCLGIEFSRNNDTIALHQSGYIRDILDRFGMTESKPVSTPMDPNVKLVKPDENSDIGATKIPYREFIGALIYLAVSTRPDIAFAISSLSQFNDCYDQNHWNAAKRVLRYLKGTIDLGLVFSHSPDPLKCFVDSDWASCPNDRRSYTGYTTILNNGPISWEAKKQRTVALSSTEAEYIGLSETSKEAVYLRNFLTELGFQELADVVIFIDNLGAQKLAENPIFHARSKHIDVRHHFIREVLKNNQVKIKHVPTEDMTADLLTKGLPKPKHDRCVKLLGLGSPASASKIRSRIEGKC